jgi:hypothetical protein
LLGHKFSHNQGTLNSVCPLPFRLLDYLFLIERVFPILLAFTQSG